MAVSMLRMAACYVMADAMMLVFGGALRGAGDTFWVMCISVTMHWVLVAVLAVAIRVWHLPPQTAWTLLCLTLLLFSGILYLRYRSGNWRNIKVIGDETELVILPLRETESL